LLKGKRKTQKLSEVEYCGFPIVERYKYLGVWLDERMTMNIHKSETENRVRKTYFKFRPFLSQKKEISIRRRLFQTFSGCLFDYAAVAMTAAGKADEW